jgi:hypothetical protein
MLGHLRHQRSGSASGEELLRRDHAPQPYFATFWLDPRGFMFEAVCHHDLD